MILPSREATTQPTTECSQLLFSLSSTAFMRPAGWFSLSYEWFGVSSPFDPTCRLVTSPFFSPLTLGALRLLLAVYSLVTTITVLVFESVRYRDASG
jgi:hypothetical protein